MRVFGIPWAVRRIRAGVMGALMGIEVEVIGRLSEMAGAADVIPEQTMPQRWWLKVVLPLARAWLTDPQLGEALLWLARQTAADLAEYVPDASTARQASGSVLAEWLRASVDGDVPDAVRWRPGLTLAEGWSRAQQWHAAAQIAEAKTVPNLPFPEPWLPRGVVGDFEIIPLTDRPPWWHRARNSTTASELMSTVSPRVVVFSIE